MTKQLMFISSSQPLAGAKVRLADGRETTLNETGQLREILPAETNQVEVLVEGVWKTQTIDLSSGSCSLMVIDVSRSHQLLGSLLGKRYRVDSVLGSGGMGVVYRATDTRLGRDVAIKMLSEQFRSNEEARRLFLAEARQMAPLSHTHLVSIYDVATIEGYDLMVTELVEGQNLDEILTERGPFAIDEALLAAFQLTVAVEFLHQRGVIHRDLKPANAIRQPNGSVKLIDFGLARSFDHLIAQGTAVRGTPAYMAPEQLTGSKLTGATDVYQLGTTIYELLSNEHPIDVSSGNLLSKIDQSPRPLESFRSDIPTPLLALINRCLNKEPADRPTARELAEKLSTFYAQRTGTSPSTSNGSFSVPNIPPDSPIEPPPERRRPLAGVLIALIVVAAIVVATFVGLTQIELEEDAQDSSPIVQKPSAPAESTAPEEPSITAEIIDSPDHLRSAELVAHSVGTQARNLAASPTSPPTPEPAASSPSTPSPQPPEQLTSPQPPDEPAPKESAEDDDPAPLAQESEEQTPPDEEIPQEGPADDQANSSIAPEPIRPEPVTLPPRPDPADTPEEEAQVIEQPAPSEVTDQAVDDEGPEEEEESSPRRPPRSF